MELGVDLGYGVGYFVLSPNRTSVGDARIVLRRKVLAGMFVTYKHKSLLFG